MIDLDDLELPGDEDGYLSQAPSGAVGEHWREYASEACVGETERPRYDHEGGSYFQDADGTVTFNIAERKISLSATARLEVVEISEEEEEVKETWDV
jgi:hypothetical protein